MKIKEPLGGMTETMALPFHGAQAMKTPLRAEGSDWPAGLGGKWRWLGR